MSAPLPSINCQVCRFEFAQSTTPSSSSGGILCPGCGTPAERTARAFAATFSAQPSSASVGSSAASPADRRLNSYQPNMTPEEVTALLVGSEPINSALNFNFIIRKSQTEGFFTIVHQAPSSPFKTLRIQCRIQDRKLFISDLQTKREIEIAGTFSNVQNIVDAILKGDLIIQNSPPQGRT